MPCLAAAQWSPLVDCLLQGVGSGSSGRRTRGGSGEGEDTQEGGRMAVNRKRCRIIEVASLIFMSSLPSVRVMPGLEEHLKGDSYPVVACTERAWGTGPGRLWRLLRSRVS